MQGVDPLVSITVINTKSFFKEIASVTDLSQACIIYEFKFLLRLKKTCSKFAGALSPVLLLLSAL